MIKLKLKKILEERKMSISQLSRETGIAYPATFDMVNQKRTAINFNNLYKIIEVLGIDDISEVMYITEKADEVK